MAIRDRYNRESKNPSFSSTLLAEIYQSMDEGTEKTNGDLKVHSDVVDEEDTKSLRRACLIEKWMEKHVTEKVFTERRQHLVESDRKSQNNSDHDLDQDGVLFSSTSLSSDSSFGGFSSSDSESIHGKNSSKTSCFAPPWLKPIRTDVHSRSEKTEKKQRALFHEHREFHFFDDYRCNGDKNPDYNESMIKSKSRALKIYSQLKKVKDPISPGGRVASFLNSLFTTGTIKKTKNSASTSTSTSCSSASSFSRSCLSKKHSLSAREELRNGADKRTVRFYPVSIIVDEDCRPCGHKKLCEENESTIMASNVPIERINGRLQLEFHMNEERELVNESARKIVSEFEYQRYEEEDEDDDTESCSSSDLFELDHRAILELPVYETTRFDPNLVIGKA